MALGTIRTHKLRSFLTVLGVIIGTTTVIAVGSIIAGLNANIIEQIQSTGTDTASISTFPQGPHFGRLTREERMRKPFTLEDGLALRDCCAAVKNVTVSIFPGRGFVTAKYKSDTVVGLDHRGVTPEFFSVYANVTLESGRFYGEAENEHRADVIVIGHDLARTLYGQSDPVGKEIQINGHSYEIIGVLERPRAMGPGGEDRRAVVPYWTFRKVNPTSLEHFIRLEAYPDRLNEAVDQVRAVLRNRRRVPLNKPDDFSIATADQMIERFHEITGAVFLVMVVLSSIGLLVGGIGVMNIMLVSVT